LIISQSVNLFSNIKAAQYDTSHKTGPALANWQPCSQWCIAKKTPRGWGSWGGGVPSPAD